MMNGQTLLRALTTSTSLATSTTSNHHMVLFCVDLILWETTNQKFLKIKMFLSMRPENIAKINLIISCISTLNIGKDHCIIC